MICMFFCQTDRAFLYNLYKGVPGDRGGNFTKKKGEDAIICIFPVNTYWVDLLDSVKDCHSFSRDYFYLSQLSKPFLIDGVVPICLHKYGTAEGRVQPTAEEEKHHIPCHLIFNQKRCINIGIKGKDLGPKQIKVKIPI